MLQHKILKNTSGKKYLVEKVLLPSDSLIYLFILFNFFFFDDEFFFFYSIILESDAMSVTQRVNYRTGDDIPLGEQTVAQVQLIVPIVPESLRLPPPPPPSPSRSESIQYNRVGCKDLKSADMSRNSISH